MIKNRRLEFTLLQKKKLVSEGAVFDEAAVDLSAVDDKSMYLKSCAVAFGPELALVNSGNVRHAPSVECAL